MPGTGSAKKARTLVSPTIVFTGVRPTEAQKRLLKTLGASIGDSLEPADFVVAKQIARTEKFLLAISRGIPIVDERWLAEVTVQKKLLDPAHFPLLDRQNEQVFDFVLAKAVERGRTAKLLEGYTCYCSLHIEPSPAIIARLVQAAGGLFKGVLTPKKTLNLSVISSSHKIICFATESDLCTLGGLGHPLYSSELLLDGLLRQRLEFEPYKLELS
ncbi:hypothetical protein HDU91_003079 [Kappamyces sp. JEL0680]|nr:hypothetical protein HDU91_003079 [Kappamyces sp. JEL0680]